MFRRAVRDPGVGGGNRHLVDTSRVQGNEQLQVLEGENHERSIELRQPRPKHSGDPKNIVSHRTVGSWRDDDDLVSDLYRQLACHLDPDDQLVTPGRGESTVAQLVKEPAQERFELRVDPHQHSGRRRLAGTDEATCVDAGGGRYHGRVARHGAEELGDVHAITAADRLVQASLGTVVARVNLDLAADKPRRVLDHLGRDAARPAHDEDNGEIARAESQRGEDGPFPVTPQIAPANPDPGTRGHRQLSQTLDILQGEERPIDLDVEVQLLITDGRVLTRLVFRVDLYH